MGLLAHWRGDAASRDFGEKVPFLNWREIPSGVLFEFRGMMWRWAWLTSIDSILAVG